ncbi:MAG: murein biosynthesis integral membrane protein MurJ [candidate division Zixibacteria bacterium]|nr:murein biosynthesis integral membrane protein MurJ [candidate division Zixibacteria bacterium]
MDISNQQSMASSAGRVSLATAISRILGLVREQVQAYFFGAGMATDCFVAAFRVPNLLRDLFAEGALSSAFIPVFKEKIIRRSREEAYRLANFTMSDLILITGAIVALGIIFTPAIIYVTAKGFLNEPGKFDLTVNLTRLMFVFLIMVSVSAVQMGILNSMGRFGVPALSSALFNVGMIIAPIFLYSYFDVPIYTMAIGVIIGGIGQIVFQLPSLARIGFKFKFSLNFKDEGIRRIGRLLSPMVLGLSASRINILISTLLASLLVQGAMSYLSYAYRLMHFPLGVFGVALGTVALPKISEDVARNNFDQLLKTFYEAIGLSMFLIVPSAVYLAGFGEDLVRLIYQRGAFDAEATLRTAQSLLYYSIGLVGFAGVRVAAPVYYALGDAKRPMYYSIVSVLLNIIFNFAFIFLFGGLSSPNAIAGLAAATSVAGLANFLLLIVNLRKMVGGVNYTYLVVHFMKISVGALLALLAIRFFRIDAIIHVTGLWTKILVVFLQVSGMAAIYLLILHLMKVREVGRLLGLLRRIR